METGPVRVTRRMADTLADTLVWSLRTGNPPDILRALPNTPAYTLRGIINRSLTIDRDPPVLNEDGILIAQEYINARVRSGYTPAPPSDAPHPGDLRPGDVVSFLYRPSREEPRRIRGRVTRVRERSATVIDERTGECRRLFAANVPHNELRLLRPARRLPYTEETVRLVRHQDRLLALWHPSPDLSDADAAYEVLHRPAGSRSSRGELIAHAQRLGRGSGVRGGSWSVHYGRSAHGPLRHIAEARSLLRSIAARHVSARERNRRS